MGPRKRRLNKVLLIIPIVLMIFGLIVIYAIGPQRANFMNAREGTSYSEHFFFFKQFGAVLLSIGCMIFTYKMPYEQIRKIAKWLIFGSLAACALLALLSVMGSGLAKCELGGCRWFNLPIISSIQPAEFLKAGMVLYLAQMVAKLRKEGKKIETSSDFWVPFLLISILSLVFVVGAQQDLGTGMAIIAIIFTILYMGGASWKMLLAMVIVILCFAAGAIRVAPHRMERLMTFLGYGDQYHLDNAKMAIGVGGFSGVGIGNSVQATGYLPESINDSVFAVMGETFGFVGLAVVLALFMTLFMKMVDVAAHLDIEESLVVSGVLAWLAVHTIVNITSMIGLSPLTGITLPFLSYGGTSMVMMSLVLGLVLQLSCYTKKEVRKDESISSGRRFRGTHYSSRRRSA